MITLKHVKTRVVIHNVKEKITRLGWKPRVNELKYKPGVGRDGMPSIPLRQTVPFMGAGSAGTFAHVLNKDILREKEHQPGNY